MYSRYLGKSCMPERFSKDEAGGEAGLDGLMPRLIS